MKKIFLIFNLLFFSFLLGQENNTDSTGLQVYKVKKKENFDLFALDKLETYDEPILVQNDFEYFYDNLFSLTDTGDKKYKNLMIPQGGMPVVWVLNGEKIYAFWIFAKDDDAYYNCYDTCLNDDLYCSPYSFGISYSYEKGKNDRLKLEKMNTYTGKHFGRNNVEFYCVPPSVEFKNNSTEYYPEYNNFIKKVAKIIFHEVKCRTWKIVLSGHTDRNGSKEYNHELSKKRVAVVKKRLIELGVKEEYFALDEYYGEERILNHCLNDYHFYCTDEENRINRRVEFKLSAD